jgi:hypothetical protein
MNTPRTAGNKRYLPLRAALLGTMLGLGALSTPASAQIGVSIDIGIPPPPVRIEVVPAVRAGYVWAPGYWGWQGGAHVWMPGRWNAARAGHRWAPERWETRNGRYVFVPGRWDADVHAAGPGGPPAHHDNGRHEGQHKGKGKK